jgi:hypothetical protein
MPMEQGYCNRPLVLTSVVLTPYIETGLDKRDSRKLQSGPKDPKASFREVAPGLDNALGPHFCIISQQFMQRRFHLIRNRFSAVIAVCLTGLWASQDIRALFAAAPQRPSWLFPLDSLPLLPTWSVVALNLFFSVYLLWIMFWLVRGTEGWERVMVAGFSVSAGRIPLEPIGALSFQPAITVIRAVGAAGMGTAFFAALIVLAESPAFGRDDARTALSLLFILGCLVVFTLAVGAIGYFARP